MSCFHPLTAFRVCGRGTLFFSFPADVPPSQVERVSLPCGHCVGCLFDRARDWAYRACVESREHKQNCFLTLTYADAYLPKTADGLPTLAKAELQSFIKRFRSRTQKNIRYIACGEYGPQTLRPHYHAVVFGYDFPDRCRVSGLDKVTGEYFSHDVSAELCSLWPVGHCSIGDFSPSAAAYVCRYTLKKHYGMSPKDKEAYYQGRQEEFILTSRRPGIGQKHFERYYFSDICARDKVYFQGHFFRPPRYYDKQLEKIDETLLSEIKLRRSANVADVPREELYRREQVHLYNKRQKFQRGL